MRGVVRVDAAGRGESITRRLLSFARYGDAHIESIAVAEVLNNVREVLAHTLGSTIEVRDSASSNLPRLMADPGQLETALINLGINARDAMPGGGKLTLTGDVETVDDGDSNGLGSGEYLRLSIVDTGVGMDEATLARATEPFFTTKPPGYGTGLGLAMVKAFIEQSKGAMSITSAPGAGTTVMMWLPQAAGNAAVVPDTEHSEPKMMAAASARVLLVDDDDLVRETLAAQLDDIGFTTLVAASGSEALAMIEAGEFIDALVTDLSMPIMDGVTTIQKVRALRPCLPCYLLTGYVGERAALSVPDTFTLVRKPVTAAALASLIEAELQSAGH